MSNAAERVREKLSGPVYPVLTAFDQKGEVDYDAIGSYVRFLVRNGAPTILVTVGTSRFNLLTPDEMKRVNRKVVEAVDGDALAIAAGPLQASRDENIRFAEHATVVGADALIVKYPERYYGDQPIFDFFEDVQKSSEIPVLIHEMPMRNGFGGPQVNYSLDLLSELAELPNVAGLKEECMDGEYAYRILRTVTDRTGVIGAGSMRRFLRDHHAGATCFLVGIGSFLPGLAVRFHEHVMADAVDEAHEIVRKHEDAYFDVAVNMGWHRALKETLYQLDLMPPYERAPMNRLDQEQRDRMAEIISILGWRDLIGRSAAGG